MPEPLNHHETTTPAIPTLNGFESRLLDELQQELAARQARGGATIASGSGPRRPVRRVRVALAAAACLAVAGGVGLVHLQAQPAWAVDPHPDGTVTITVNRPEGAAQLQQRLAQVGIRADITFPADGTRCADGRITPAIETSGSDDSIQMVSGGRNKVRVVVRPGRMAKGTSLVLEVWATRQGVDAVDGGGVVVDTVKGRVPACHLVPVKAEDLPPDPTPSR